MSSTCQAVALGLDDPLTSSYTFPTFPEPTRDFTVFPSTKSRQSVLITARTSPGVIHLELLSSKRATFSIVVTCTLALTRLIDRSMWTLMLFVFEGQLHRSETVDGF